MAGQPQIPDDIKQLVLVKKDQRWVFRYVPGSESEVIGSLAAAASDPDTALDWFDAAVLSHQMGHRLAVQLNRLRKP